MVSMTNDTIEQSFAVGTPAELSVSAVSGRVAIRAGGDGSITVRAEKSGSEHAKAATLIDLRQEGNRVSVHTTQAEGVQNGYANIGKNLASVYYDITVPLGCTIGVKTVS